MGPVSTRGIAPTTATNSRDQEQGGCAQDKGEEVRSEGASTPRDNAVEKECGRKVGSELHGMGGSSNARSGSGSPGAGWEGVDGNVLQRAAQSVGPNRVTTPTTPPGGDITAKAEDNAARKETALNDTPVAGVRTNSHQGNPGKPQHLGSGNSLPLKTSSSLDHYDDPPLLLVNGSATESEVAKCQGLSSTSLVLRKRARDGVPKVGGALGEGGACVRDEDDPPAKLPRCTPTDNSPLSPEPTGKYT